MAAAIFHTETDDLATAITQQTADTLRPPPPKRRRKTHTGAQDDDSGDAAAMHAGGTEELQEIATTFRDNSVHQQAFAAYIANVLQHPLAWAKRTGPGPEDIKWPPVAYATKIPEIPQWVRRFVRDAIESYLIAGWFVWTHDEKQQAATVIPPELITIKSHPANQQWHINHQESMEAAAWAQGDPKKNLNLVIVDPPSRAGCRSGAKRAQRDTARYTAMELRFDQRDACNSTPAIYTTISQDIKNQNGSTRQWFRTANSADVAGLRGSIDTNFNDLIARRADTIRKLRDITVAEKERLAAEHSAAHAHAPLGSLAAADDAAAFQEQQQHEELIVSDGRDYTQLKMLQSMTDGKTEIDRLYTNIMIAFGVPPQVFGKNVNTERHAASNRLTESAVDMFQHQCSLIRTHLSAALNKACQKPHGPFLVTFKPHLRKEDIDKMAPILKPDFAAMAIAAAYNIPEKYIDKQQLKAINLFDHGRVRMFQGADQKPIKGNPLAATAQTPNSKPNQGAAPAKVATNDKDQAKREKTQGI